MAGIFGFFLGAGLGALLAARRGGNLKDIVQYGVVFGLVLALVGLLVSIVALRMGWI